MKKTLIVLFTVMITFLLNSCSGRSSSETFLREEISFDFINKVAVLPFENHTKDRYVAERVRDVALTQLLALGISDAVDKGIVDSILREEAIEPGKPIDLINLNRLGQRLNVEAFLIGSVDESAQIRKGSMTFPQIAVTLRLVDAKASVVLWQASGRQTGESVMGRVFGLSPTDEFHVTLKLLRKLLSTLPSTVN